MKIIPSQGIVYIKVEENKAGILDTSSKETAVEIAEVLEVGEGVKEYNKGDKIFVKAWGIDLISYNDKKFHFVNIDTKAILCVIK